MRIGVAQCDITPPVGAELSGFAARMQPSIGVLDSLHARVIHLTDGLEQLLWLQCDLIGLDDEFVADFVAWARRERGLSARQIILAATHTHSGPGTIRLEEAGRYDERYLAALGVKLRATAARAMARADMCRLVTATAEHALAVDRRRGNQPRAGLQVAAAAFVRNDATIAAVLANYPVHPVALGASNRRVSGDVPGQAARVFSALLAGAPVALVASGACGDLNPPGENVPVAQVEAWGAEIACRIIPALCEAAPRHTDFALAGTTVALPLEVLTADEIERCARTALHDTAAASTWGDKFRRVVETWRRRQLAAIARPDAPRDRLVKVTVVRLRDLYFVALNAEIFSEFNDRVRAATGRDVHTIGCANGNLGYIAPHDAYAEGGYEVDHAHFFYGGFRFRPGGLELLVPIAAELVNGLAATRAHHAAREGFAHARG